MRAMILAMKTTMRIVNDDDGDDADDHDNDHDAYHDDGDDDVIHPPPVPIKQTVSTRGVPWGVPPPWGADGETTRGYPAGYHGWGGPRWGTRGREFHGGYTWEGW
jgi:hypothetical protein